MNSTAANNKKVVGVHQQECWNPIRKGHHMHPALGERQTIVRWFYADVRKPLRNRKPIWKANVHSGSRERRSETDITKMFWTVAHKWKRETAMSSIVYDKITNPYYMQIIGMGITFKDKVIKLILEDLKGGTEHWHYALKSITNQNPVPKGQVNNLKIVRESWLKWGEENYKI
jgi:hypothetical protein